MEDISLARKITEIDRLDLLRAQVLKEFAAAVRAAADRLIGYEETTVAGHRDRLRIVAAEIETAHSMEALRRACQRMATVLDEHRTEGEKLIAHLRTIDLT